MKLYTMSPRLLRNGFIYLLITVAVLAIFLTLFSDSLGGSEEIPINEVISRSVRGEIEKIEVRNDRLTVFTTSGETFASRKESGASMVDRLRESGVDPAVSGVSVEVKGAGGLSSIFGVLLNFLPLIFFGAVLLFMMRQAQGSGSQTFSFGKSRARMFVGNSPAVSFSDVAGVEEAKEELEEVVQFPQGA